MAMTMMWLCRIHGRLGLAVLFFSLVQGTAGTLKLFVLHKTNQVPHHQPGPHCGSDPERECEKVGKPTMRHHAQRFLRWHGRLGTLIYASSLTAVLSGAYAQLDLGS